MRTTLKAKALVTLVLGACLSGCPRSYFYDSIEYPTREDALEAQLEQQADALSKIEPLPSPVADLAVIGIPDASILHLNGTYGDSSVRKSLVAFLQNEMQFTVAAIVKRNIFRKVLVQSTHGQDLEPRQGGVAVYMYMPSQQANGWYLKTTIGARTPLFFDRGHQDLEVRTMYFLKSLQRLVTAGPQSAIPGSQASSHFPRDPTLRGL
jgi:hypothetical protein